MNQIPDSSLISAFNSIRRNMMAFFGNTFCYPVYGQFIILQPDINEGYLIVPSMRFMNHRHETPGGECSLYRNINAIFKQFFNTVQHDPSRIKGDSLNIEWRTATGNIIRIHKFPAIQQFR